MKIIIETPQPDEEDAVIVRCASPDQRLIAMLCAFQTANTELTGYLEGKIVRLNYQDVFYFGNYSVLKANCPWNIESSASKAAIPAFAAVEVKAFSNRKSIAPCSERNVPMTLLFILTIRRSRSA